MARRRSGKKIDFTHWTGFSGTSVAQSAGSVGVTLGAAVHEPETLLRIRGEALVFVDANQAPGTRVLVTMGIINVAEGTGTVVNWAPFTDADAPWIWYWSCVVGYEEYVIDVIDCPQLSSNRVVIDSKSMRILRNQELQFVVENTTLGSATSINAEVSGRILTGT